MLGLVAGSVGGGTDVCLPRRLDCKCASVRENVCGASEGETVRGGGGPESQTASASPTEEGQDAYPHKVTKDMCNTLI